MMNIELRNIECRRVDARLRRAFYLMGRGNLIDYLCFSIYFGARLRRIWLCWTFGVWRDGFGLVVLLGADGKKVVDTLSLP